MINPRISLVMATYNGADHLNQQLSSIKSQSLQPDEVLIFDDQSTDNSVDIITSFINNNHLSHWSITVNKENLGWKKNFIIGIGKASGDYIFLCDQDDIWYENKIEWMIKAIQENQEILLLACDYDIIYEPGAIKSKVYKKKRSEKKGLINRYRFTKSFFKNPKPGCSYVFRRQFFNEVAQLWFENAPHDEFLWLMATIQDGAFFYNSKMMSYVRYANNASEIRYKDIKMQLENLEYINETLLRLKQFSEQYPNRVKPEKRRIIDQAICWCEKRQKLMYSRNPKDWLKTIPWWGYYNSPKNCLSDLYLVIFGSFKRKPI